MPSTYEPIATTTLGSAASTITFSSIPATYTDLVVVGTQLGNYIELRMNGTSGSSTAYSRTTLGGDGTSALSQRSSSTSGVEITTYSGFNDTTNPKFFRINIFSYAGSTNKTVLSEAGIDRNGTGGVDRTVGLYRSTSAITSIELFAGTNGWASGSTATLYGIKNA